MIVYDYKIIQAGRLIREMKFKKPICRYGSCTSKKPITASLKSVKMADEAESPPLSERDYRLENVRRKQKLIEVLANGNFDSQYTTLITFTYRENLVDVKKANHDFNLFMKRLKDKLKKYGYPHKGFKLKFIKVIEFQERNAIHFHVVSNLRVFPFSKSVVQKWRDGGTLRADWKDEDNLQDIWRGKDKDKGNADLEQVAYKEMGEVVTYLTQYMTKDMLYDERLRNEKAYSTSRNLKMPIERLNDEGREFMQKVHEEHQVRKSENRKDTWEYTPDALPDQTITQTTYYITD